MPDFIWGGIIIGGLAFLSMAVWFVSGLLNDSRKSNEELQRRIEIESGVIISNAKADNSLPDSNLDKRVRRKFANRSRG